MKERSTERRTEALFQEQWEANARRTDRMFVWLMGCQWLASIVVALTFSPYTWEGKSRAVHMHVWIALFLGGLISSLPMALGILRPGKASTRYVVAVAQMLWSALLIHLTGGRIETHFHVFGSLAFLAFYRDWRALVPATVVVASDHLLRQLFWPESVFGIVNPEWWRFLEHAFWVVFEDIVLVMACLAGVQEMRTIARRTAEAESLSLLETEKSVALQAAIAELHDTQESLVRTEKLAAVGQLAASVGHELRNPLGAVRNAVTYIGKRHADGQVLTDARIPTFLTIIDRELGVCGKIIGDLLDFARERAPELQPCPLRPLVEEAIALVPKGGARIENAVPETLPVPSLDKDQFRQVLSNLVQNAVEAMPAEREGLVRVVADGGDGQPFRIAVEDDGTGIPPETARRIFEPLFTTKTKGTGLGLAIVSNLVKAHGGTIRVDDGVARGARFVIELPSSPALVAA